MQKKEAAMAHKTGTSLEEYLRDYIKGREVSNCADTYAEYKRERGYSHEEDYHRAMTEALARAERSAYGRENEAAGARGITGGFSKYLATRGKESLTAALTELEQKRERGASEAYRGYLGYLDGYGKNQDKIRFNVINHLSKNEVYSPELIYRYAIGAGLSEEAAIQTVGDVQVSTRDKIRTRLIDMIHSLTITPEAAAERAREYGLPDEDIRYILESTKGYHENYTEYSEELLNEILKRGQGLTPTFSK